MKPKISLITLGVTNLQASLAFYRDGLGLAAPDYQEGADVVFFPMEGTWNH
ncbi:MAG: VOC family protein [Anaerolineales bacterium]|nr:VOC family protein [Anaerolineales bacterium]